MKLSSKSSLFAIIIVVIVFSLFYQRLANMWQNNYTQPPLIKPIPSPIPLENSDVHSPDGTIKLIMQAQKNKNGSKAYSFSVSDIPEKNQKPLFSKKIDLGSEMFIPFNTWSPDNKYLFIQEKDPKSLSAFVFKADGSVFSNNQQYFDIVPLFSQQNSQYYIRDITGWDSPTLLHVLTKTIDQDKKGPPYWFDVQSKTFIQLAR